MGFALSLVTIGILSTSTLSILNDNYSSPNNTPSDSSAQLYSSGMEAGAGATPFKIETRHGISVQTAYVGTDGYLYAAGYNTYGPFGIGNTTQQSTHVKVGTNTSGGMTSAGFYEPIDYAFANNGIVVDNYGKVWTSGNNSTGELGQGNTTTDYYFTKVSTGTGTYDLPSNYEAVAVSAGLYESLILTDDGYLYGAGQQYNIGIGTDATAQNTFTRLDGRATDLPVAGGSSGDIVDFSVATSSHYAVYVLYENGDVYYTSSNASYYNKYTKIASNITMFDADGNYAYMYNESTGYIQYHQQHTAAAVNLIKPTEEVVQVRGGSHSGGWGYLTSNGNLYLSSSSASTAPTYSNSTPTGTTFYQISDVAYFDMGGSSSEMNYGVLFNDGTMEIWGQNNQGQLGIGSTSGTLTYANAFTPTTGGGVDEDYFTNGFSRGLQSTPPAKKTPNKGV